MKHFQFALNSLWNRVHNWCFILSHCDVWYPEGLDCTRTQLDNPSSAQPIRAPPKTHFPTKMKLFTLATLYPGFELDGKWANRFSSLKYILDSRTIFWLFFGLFSICTLQLSDPWRTLDLRERKTYLHLSIGKTPPAPSILPLFLLLIPIIVKIFYDQSKLDVFLIHDIRQKTATCCDRDTKAWCKNRSRLGAILEESVRPSGRS